MRRTEQVQELLTRELGALIHKELDIPPSVLVTITKVELDESFLHAVVLISVWPDSQRIEVFKELNQRTQEFRYLLGRRLPNFHPLPSLRFKFDERVRDAARIEELAKKLQNEEDSVV